MLEALSLGCVRGERRLFRDLAFSVKPGEIIEIHGPNGSGKTSLLRIVCGLASPAEGEVRWNGTNIKRLGEEYVASITYVAHQNGVKDELSAMENLLVSQRVAGHALNKQEAGAVLEQMGLGDQRNLPTRLLSAGQRRRLALARLPASRARLWILDEVLASLDDTGVALALDLIAKHLSKGGLAIIATHRELNLNAGAMQRIELAK